MWAFLRNSPLFAQREGGEHTHPVLNLIKEVLFDLLLELKKIKRELINSVKLDVFNCIGQYVFNSVLYRSTIKAIIKS